MVFCSNRNAACMKIADTIKDKSPDEIRQMFNIEDDFTEEERVSLSVRSPLVSD